MQVHGFIDLRRHDNGEKGKYGSYEGNKCANMYIGKPYETLFIGVGYI